MVIQKLSRAAKPIERFRGSGFKGLEIKVWVWGLAFKVQGTGFFRGSSRGSFTRISGFCLWVLVWNRSTTASARLLTIFNEDKEITRECFARRANGGGCPAVL